MKISIFIIFYTGILQRCWNRQPVVAAKVESWLVTCVCGLRCVVIVVLLRLVHSNYEHISAVSCDTLLSFHFLPDIRLQSRDMTHPFPWSNQRIGVDKVSTWLQSYKQRDCLLKTKSCFNTQSNDWIKIPDTNFVNFFDYICFLDFNFFRPTQINLILFWG